MADARDNFRASAYKKAGKAIPLDLAKKIGDQAAIDRKIRENKAYAARANMPKPQTGIMGSAATGFRTAHDQVVNKDNMDAIMISGHPTHNKVMNENYAPVLEANKAEKAAKNTPINVPRVNGDVEDDPRFVFGGTDGSGRGIYKTEGPRIINRDGRSLLTNVSAGRLSNQFNNNLTQTPLQQELYKRKGGFVTNNGTGETSYTGGTPLDPKTRKMLENIGMVKAPMSKQEIEQRKSDAFIANYQTLLNDGRSPQEAEIMANNIRNGKAIDTGVNLGPQVQTIAAPSHGGFFESIGKLGSAIREDRQRRSDERFNRKQYDIEQKNAADINLANETAKYYGRNKESLINSRDTKTKGKAIENSFLPKKLMAEIGLTDAKAKEITDSSEYKKLLAKARIAKIQADTGNVKAKNEMIQLEKQMKEMFLTGAK